MHLNNDVYTNYFDDMAYFIAETIEAQVYVNQNDAISDLQLPILASISFVCSSWNMNDILNQVDNRNNVLFLADQTHYLQLISKMKGTRTLSIPSRNPSESPLVRCDNMVIARKVSVLLFIIMWGIINILSLIETSFNWKHLIVFLMDP